MKNATITMTAQTIQVAILLFVAIFFVFCENIVTILFNLSILDLLLEKEQFHPNDAQKSNYNETESLLWQFVDDTFGKSCSGEWSRYEQ